MTARAGAAAALPEGNAPPRRVVDEEPAQAGAAAALPGGNAPPRRVVAEARAGEAPVRGLSSSPRRVSVADGFAAISASSPRTRVWSSSISPFYNIPYHIPDRKGDHSSTLATACCIKSNGCFFWGENKDPTYERLRR